MNGENLTGRFWPVSDRKPNVNYLESLTVKRPITDYRKYGRVASS